MNYLKTFTAAVLMLSNSHLIAGTTCEQKIPSPDLYRKASAKALELRKKLNRLNPKVILIARVGTDLRKYGLYYSHMAFIIHSEPAKARKWTVMHLLNDCGTRSSKIYKQGLLNFMLAYPYSIKYQNSNQWVLEILTNAMNSKADDSRLKAQNYLQKTHYQPFKIKISPLTKLWAAAFAKSVRFDDHPQNEQRMNQFSTVTVDSIVNYLKRQGVCQDSNF